MLRFILNVFFVLLLWEGLKITSIDQSVVVLQFSPFLTRVIIIGEFLYYFFEVFVPFLYNKFSSLFGINKYKGSDE